MARRRKIESVEWIEATRFLIHWFPQIDAERLAYGGVLSGNGYFAPGTRDSVDSGVKYKNDTEGGSKEDIPISIFFSSSLFFSLLFPLSRNDRTCLFFRTALIDDFEETNRVIFSSNFLIFLRGKRRSTMSSNRIQRFFPCFRKQRKERPRFLAL